MAHVDAREGKWRGNWRMEWVASTLHTTSEHGVSNITTADTQTSAASSRLNWRPRRFKWNRPFRRKTKSGFCACAITFQTQSNVKKRHNALSCFHRENGCANASQCYVIAYSLFRQFVCVCVCVCEYVWVSPIRDKEAERFGRDEAPRNIKNEDKHLMWNAKCSSRQSQYTQSYLAR